MGSLFSSALGFALVGLFHTDFRYSLLESLVLAMPLFAVGGALLGTALGWIASRFSEMGRLSIYHHHLRQGHYLLMIEGSEKTVRLSQEVLGQYATPKA